MMNITISDMQNGRYDMSAKQGQYIAPLVGITALAGLYLVSLANYKLFHTLLELITVVIAAGIFLLTWNVRVYLTNNYLKIIGFCYISIAAINLLHALTYGGVNLIPGYDGNSSIQFWTAEAFLLSITILIASFSVGGRTPSDFTIVGCFAIAALVLSIAIFSGYFPDCFIAGKGLTAFKVYSEYAVIVMLMISLFPLYRKRDQFNKRVFNIIISSLILTIIAEFFFSGYTTLFDLANLTGHMIKGAAYCLIYQAIFVTGLREPFNIVFRDLKQTEQELREHQETLEERIRERTEELRIQTVELEEEVAERQMAQEALQEKATLLEEEIEKRQKAQEELETFNEHLEQRIQERTAELTDKNAELKAAYDELKVAQAQLLHQDKMASIGQLAAGVAHEINNPMGFISSNISSLGRYAEKLTSYLEAGERLIAGAAPEMAASLAEQRRSLKIDRILQDLPELINESLDGTERVRKIVHELKAFSHVDRAEQSSVDLNEGLESTLAIVWNELKYKATVIKEYGELPKVSCNPGQLNQVYMNLLVNAAQAIESQGEIRIRTWTEGDSVRVTISDTGCGIPEEVRKHIFDPFFTTKEVGKGTGLGLSIAYDIVVNKHGGSIDVQSEIGKGSTFTIALPTEPKDFPIKLEGLA